MRCCNAWKRAIGVPNCWRVLRVFDGGVVQRIKHADCFRAQQQRAIVGDALERRCARMLATETNRAGVP
jgi:hypothetical protein